MFSVTFDRQELAVSTSSHQWLATGVRVLPGAAQPRAMYAFTAVAYESAAAFQP